MAPSTHPLWGCLQRGNGSSFPRGQWILLFVSNPLLEVLEKSEPSQAFRAAQQQSLLQVKQSTSVQISAESFSQAMKISEKKQQFQDVAALLALEGPVSASSGIPHSGDCPALILLTHIPLIEPQNVQYQCGGRTTELSLDRRDVRALPRSTGVTNIPWIFPVVLACGHPGEDIFLNSGSYFNCEIFTTGASLGDTQWTDLSRQKAPKLSLPSPQDFPQTDKAPFFASSNFSRSQRTHAGVNCFIHTNTQRYNMYT